MTQLADEDPIRAIENALERLGRAAEGTSLESHVAEERAIVARALVVLVPPATREAVRRCLECGLVYRDDESGPCPRCDLFGGA